MKLGLLVEQSLENDKLEQLLKSHYAVAWKTQDSQTAASRSSKEPVDLLLLELHQHWTPSLLEQLLPTICCPVMLFSTDGVDHTQTVFAALGKGAKDYVALQRSNLKSTDLLLRKIRQFGVLHLHDKLARRAQPTTPVVIAIGASTGGPTSLFELIRNLPADFNAVIVIIQHIDDRFSAGMAEWLEQANTLKVKLIQHNEPLLPGTIYLAGAGAHVRLSAQGTFQLSQTPKTSLFKPSIDVFLTSLAEKWPGNAIGVLLTGMGQDGALGLKQMKDHGWLTIAQDQASSVVYGMPKAAANLNAASEVISLDKIAARLIQLCS